MTDSASTPCGTCGVCCRSYLVPLCGYDVWRISTTQQLAPEQFVFAMSQQNPAPDGFLLDRTGDSYGLALDKRGRLRATQPCVFLLDLGLGQTRCGIYPDRPLVCRTYPMQGIGGRVTQRADALCPPGAWPPRSLAQASWTRAVERQRMHFDVYHLVVARWNAHVTEQVGEQSPNLGEYLTYLMNVYEEIAALERSLGAAAVAAIERQWGTGEVENNKFWLTYANAVYGIVSGFY